MAAAVADIDQSATLFNFLRCLRDYLNADGAGLTPKRLHTRVYDRLMEQLRLSRQSTSEVMWMYWQEQVCVCVCLSVCLSVWLCRHANTAARVTEKGAPQTHTHSLTFTHTFTYTFTHTHTHTLTHTHTHSHVFLTAMVLVVEQTRQKLDVRNYERPSVTVQV